MELIGFGAEAQIYKTKEGIIKKRPSKKYRHPKLDLRLRVQRARKEAKVLQKLKSLEIMAPRFQKLDEQNASIHMRTLTGPKVRDVLDTNPDLGKLIGRIVAKLHNADLVHGDLTTSNMISTKQGIALIDFGLSMTTHKIEHKAVDLHLFKKALDSKHVEVSQAVWKNFLLGYKSKQRESILKKLEVVCARGRNKK